MLWMMMPRRSIPCSPVNSLTALKASCSTGVSYLTTVKALSLHFRSSVRNRELGWVGSRLATIMDCFMTVISTGINKVEAVWDDLHGSAAQGTS